MSELDGLEHDTIQEAPGSPVGAREPREEELSGFSARREEVREQAGRGERPWCAADNPEIWTVIAGEGDDE